MTAFRRSPDDLFTRRAIDECFTKFIKEYREKGENDLADGMILVRRYGISELEPVDIDKLSEERLKKED